MKKTTNKSTAKFAVPFDVLTQSKALGNSLRLARQKRSITQADAAVRIGTTRDVVIKAEQGKSITTYNLMSLLWLYGLLEQAVSAVSEEKDLNGISMENSRLPKRIRKVKDDF